MAYLHSKRVNPISCVSLVLLIGACSSNTTLDDGSYRSIGNRAPKQIQNYAAQEGQKQAESAYADNAPEALSSQIALPDFPGQMEENPSKPAASANQPSHRARYGQAPIIDKIVKTAEIHCQQQQYPINTTENSFWGKSKGLLTQCAYRFPEHCGGHLFSILSYESKSILVFQPPEQTHYVIDTLSGTPKSKAGLWDQDDHLGTSNTNAGYLFQSDYNQNVGREQFNPSSLGWIIKASHQDQRLFGKLYHQAIEETRSCF